MTFEEAKVRWEKIWSEGQCVGIMGQELFNLPNTQLVCVPPVFLGYGLLEATRDGHTITFDGGGWCNRVEEGPDNPRFSWTSIRGSVEALAAFGLSADEQRAAFDPSKG